ncbi:type IV pilus biogenesis protein PilM [Pseudomonas oryzicola]|uniref:Pilus assembly protein PilM n=1 Tax=Pseudomonas oryzicola TaxID=485876 RepID=A0ABS6Q5K2_9PSED|nr:pilus assembly protein PilM [Pseudomonas oryzicola]MBV4489451.1 pilus assembly protein PilM [Pseudomonas oryzicola]
MLGRFGKDAGSLVGVEIAPDTVRIVQLQRHHGRHRVHVSVQESFVTPVGQDWLADPAEVVAALRRACRRNGLGQRRVALALPANMVICKLCQLPAGQDEADMEAQLLADAERLFPFPLEDLALDFQVMEGSRAQPGCVEVMVAACRQSTMAPLEAIVEEAGLQLEAVEVDSIALRRLLPQGNPEGAALLRIDVHGSTLYDWQPGRLQQRRDLQAAGVGMTEQLPGHLQALLADGQRAACLWVVSSSPIDPGWLQKLSARLHVPCRPLPGPAGLGHIDGSMLLACALALGGGRP